MAAPSSKGVLTRLTFLEAQGRKPAAQPQTRATQLKTKVEDLKKQRHRLRTEVEVHQKLQKLRKSMEENEDVDVDDDSENSKLLRLMAKHSQLKDVLLAHHLLGGYDAVKTNQNKSLCFSLPTAFQGVMLETFHLEVDLKPVVRISRHSVPPFVPVERLAQEQRLREGNVRGFLDALSLHLNAFTARRHQLQLVKEQHQSVDVLESNALCSLLVLLLSSLKDRTAVLCSLDYCDHTRSLPSRVRLQCEEQDVSDSSQWQQNSTLLQERPLHQALSLMKETRQII